MTDRARRSLSTLIAAFVLALGFSGGVKAQQPQVTVEREAYTGPAIVVRDLPEPPRFASAADIEAALTVFDWVTPPSGDPPEIAAQMGSQEARPSSFVRFPMKGPSRHVRPSAKIQEAWGSLPRPSERPELLVSARWHMAGGSVSV